MDTLTYVSIGSTLHTIALHSFILSGSTPRLPYKTLSTKERERRVSKEKEEEKVKEGEKKKDTTG